MYIVIDHLTNTLTKQHLPLPIMSCFFHTMGIYPASEDFLDFYCCSYAALKTGGLFTFSSRLAKHLTAYSLKRVFAALPAAFSFL